MVQGNGTDRGVVTLVENNQTLGYVIIQGLTIQNGRWGIDAQRTHDLNIHHNIIQDVDFGIYNRRDGGQEHNQTVSFRAGIVTVQPSATIIVNARTVYSPIILKAK